MLGSDVVPIARCATLQFNQKKEDEEEDAEWKFGARIPHNRNKKLKRRTKVVVVEKRNMTSTQEAVA